MPRKTLFGTIVVAAFTAVAASVHSPPAGQRPFFALATTGQLVPQGASEGGFVWWCMLNEATGELAVSGSYPAVNDLLRLIGPAVPGENGPLIDEERYTPGLNTFGPLSPVQVQQLTKGLLYLEISVYRGQIVPINLRYPLPGP